MANTSFLIKHPSAYLFRIKVPVDIQEKVGKKELRYSLKTGRIGEARPKARLLAGMIQQMFRQLRQENHWMCELSESQISEIIKEYVADAVEEKRRDWIMNPRTRSEINLRIGGLETCAAMLEDGYTRSDYIVLEEQAEEILGKQGIKYSKDSYEFKLFCHELVKASHQLFGMEKELLTGGITSSTATKPPQAAPIAKEKTEAAAAIPDETESSPNISEVIDFFLSEGDSTAKWTPKTREAVVSKMDLLVKVLGDIPMNTLDRTKMNTYKQTLLKLPPNMKKVKEYRGKTIPQLLEMKVEKTMAVHTINSYLGRAEEICEYALVHGYMDLNPAKGMKLARTVRPDEEKQIFDKKDLQNMFVNSDLFAYDKFNLSYQFWGPVICLFTGARVNEIAQLHLEDFKEEGGIWYIDIKDQVFCVGFGFRFALRLNRRFIGFVCLGGRLDSVLFED